MLKLKFISALFFLPSLVLASGGISIQGTRVIYSQNAKVKTLSVSNSSTTDSFLVQSWVEDSFGHKTRDFIVTPPLYVSGPKNENMLRLIYAGGSLPRDRETLYYFVVKAIPSVDDKKSVGKDVFRIATASRIKLLIRPTELTLPEEASSRLEFIRQGSLLIISNPTPYYITMTDIRVGSRRIPSIMVPPLGSISNYLPDGEGNNLIFSTINDFGAKSKFNRVVIR